MLAEIHGKISSTGSNLSDRLEDQLTGDVFGSLRYLDASSALLPFLEKSYFLTGSGQRSCPPDFSNGRVKKDIKFWPWVDEAEPDVLLELDLGGQKGCVVFIEAKYHSGLSSDDAPASPILEGEGYLLPASLVHNEPSSIEESRNQLVRQMRGMRKIFHGLRQVQVFLTADRVYPNEILSRVRQQANSEGLSDTELYWLSWHDLPTILLRSCEGGVRLFEREKMIVCDLLKLCERKGFARFSRMEFNGGRVPYRCKIVVRTQLDEAPNLIPIRILNVLNAEPLLIPIASRSVPTNRPAIYLER